MTVRVWDAFLTDADKRQLAQSGPKTASGFGRRAAVLSVNNHRDAPGNVVNQTARLLEAARAVGIQVIHVADGPAPPESGELVLTSTAPSAFFGTPLMSHLTGDGIDTLLVVGQEASGSVRATVVDGYSYRLRMIVVEQCVHDSHEASRAMSLFDIDQQYGDVLGIEEVLAWVGQPSKHDEHGHHAEHSHHSHQRGHLHGDDAAAELPLPAVVLRALPPGAIAVAVSQHPIHGRVLTRGGEELVDAARSQMAAGFGEQPHVIVQIDAETIESGDDPRYRQALELTADGAILIGVGYQVTEAVGGADADESQDERPVERRAGPASERDLVALASRIDPGECPECGATSATVDSYLPARSTPGMEHGTIVFACTVCGAGWDVPIPPGSHAPESLGG